MPGVIITTTCNEFGQAMTAGQTINTLSRLQATALFNSGLCKFSFGGPSPLPEQGVVPITSVQFADPAAYGLTAVNSLFYDFNGSRYWGNGTALVAASVSGAGIGPVAVTGTPTAGQVPIASSGTAAAWGTPAGSGLTTSAAAVTSGNIAGVVGTFHALDLSGLTAARSFVLPTAAAVDSRCGFIVTAGYTAANYDRGLIYTAGTAETLNGVAAGTEVSRCFTAGERMIFRCVSSGAWAVELDGRIAQQASIELTTPSDGNTPDAYVRPTQASTPGAWTAQKDTGAIASVSLDAIYTRRSNAFQVSIGHINKDAGTTGSYINAGAFINGSTEVVNAFWGLLVSNTGRAAASKLVPLTVGQYLQYQYRSGSLGTGALANPSNFLTVLEVL